MVDAVVYSISANVNFYYLNEKIGGKIERERERELLHFD